MQTIEKVLPFVVLAAILMTAYYSRATYEVTVPGVKQYLTKPSA